MTNNIHKHSFSISKKERQKLKKHNAFVVWFTGLSGAGKSTLANALDASLYTSGLHSYILDGDNLRQGLNSDLAFSDKDRKENIRRVSEVAKLFIDSGTIVLAAFVSPFKIDRDNARKMIEPDQFIEVFVSTPMDVCESRDTKGLYAKARKGELSDFPGINGIFEAPENPEVTIDTNQVNTDTAVRMILNKINLIVDSNA